MEPIILSKEEETVCRILYFAISQKHGLCDPSNFSDIDEQILDDFEEKGYLSNDINCMVLSKDFKDFLDKKFKEGN